MTYNKILIITEHLKSCPKVISSLFYKGVVRLLQYMNL